MLHVFQLTWLVLASRLSNDDDDVVGVLQADSPNDQSLVL
jgi:hypothetical protein